MLLVEFYYSFSLCFQLAAAWSKGNRDQSQRYTLLCARIRARKGWEPNQPLCCWVSWAAIHTKTGQNWPGIPSRNAHADVTLPRRGLKPLQSFHGSWVLTPCGMTNLPLENPAWQTCQASTRENWLWSPHRKPGPRAHDREVLWCTKAHSCLDTRNVIWGGETSEKEMSIHAACWKNCTGSMFYLNMPIYSSQNCGNVWFLSSLVSGESRTIVITCHCKNEVILCLKYQIFFLRKEFWNHFVPLPSVTRLQNF